MITAIILTRNEERHIAECLAALTWAKVRLVVDSGSIDQTCKSAIAAGAEVISHPFTSFSDQRNFAMSCVQTPWILFVDADERVSPELALEIQTVIQGEKLAYEIPRQNYFFGKRLKFSGGQKDAPLRLFPRGAGTWVQPVHEFFETELPRHRLAHALTHHTTRDLKHYHEKMACYIPLEVKTMQDQGRKVTRGDLALRPLAKFLYLYLFKLGILDGLVGLQFACLSAYYDYRRFSDYRRAIR